MSPLLEYQKVVAEEEMALSIGHVKGTTHTFSLSSLDKAFDWRISDADEIIHPLYAHISMPGNRFTRPTNARVLHGRSSKSIQY